MSTLALVGLGGVVDNGGGGAGKDNPGGGDPDGGKGGGDPEGGGDPCGAGGVQILTRFILQRVKNKRHLGRTFGIGKGRKS